jgi:hypothetical protein
MLRATAFITRWGLSPAAVTSPSTMMTAWDSRRSSDTTGRRQQAAAAQAGKHIGRTAGRPTATRRHHLAGYEAARHSEKRRL